MFLQFKFSLVNFSWKYILHLFFIGTFLERLNHAARHRNVYLDAVGGDPYGKTNFI